MLLDQVETEKGGYVMGGGVRGNATARLTLAVKGIEPADLQALTDKLHKEYVQKLEAKGFVVVTAKDVNNNEYFTGWQMVNGGRPSMAQLPGYVSTAPSGFNYMVEKVDKDGKTKKTNNIFDNGLKLSTSLGSPGRYCG